MLELQLKAYFFPSYVWKNAIYVLGYFRLLMNEMTPSKNQFILQFDELQAIIVKLGGFTIHNIAGPKGEVQEES